MTSNDVAWAVMMELHESWCDYPCKYREGCGCADAIQAAINATTTAEREACAKIADETSAWCRSFSSEETAERIAAAIRARSK